MNTAKYIGDKMGRISEENIEKIIESNDIVDVISEFVPLKRAGRGYMGVCPFHNDKGPSMSVSQEKQLYHCFGCGASGNTVGFIMKIRNLDYIDAIKYLGDRAGIKIEDEIQDPQKLKYEALRNDLFQINIEAARYFLSNLFNIRSAYEYFEKRGIDEKTIKKFGLGYSLNNYEGLYKFLKNKGFKEEFILKAGLISKKDSKVYDRFRNRVMFPVFDIKTKIIGFGGRVLDNSKPKYLNSPETPVFVKGTNLYGLNFVIKSGLPEYIIVVEGYMDCISLHQHGITNTVASLGTALTLEQAKLLKRYSKSIFICYDSDAAGQAATLRGLEILASVGCDVKIITIPRGKDPDEFIKNFGVEEFKKLIENALPVSEYRIQMTRNGKNLKDAKQKSIFVTESAEILSSLENEIEIQAYATKIYDETGIDVKFILDEVKKIKRTKNSKENNKTNNRNNNMSGNIYNLEPAYKKAEKWLIQLALTNNDYFKYISNKITLDDFITQALKTAYEFISKTLESGEEVIPSVLLLNYTEQQDINDVASLFEGLDKLKDPIKLIDDCIKTINKYNIENKINELTVKIKKHEEKNEVVESAILSQELIKLQKEFNLL